MSPLSPAKIKSALAWLLLTGVAATSHADPTVYSQPASVGGYTTWASAASPGGSTATTYDNFVLTATASVTAVQWEGNYVDQSNPGSNPEAPNTSTFQISFFSDNAGQPGPVLATQTVAYTAATPVSLGTVPFAVNEGNVQVPLLSYRAVLPTPFVATAGQTYWISILSNGTAPEPSWAWYSGTGGDGQCVQDYAGTRYVRVDDRSLALEGTPASQTVAGSVQFTAASPTGVESSGGVSLSVSRTGGSTGAISVNYATADDTAFAGTDYQALSGTLSWTDGDATAQTITVPIIDRGLASGSTTFLVNLSAPAGGATLASPTQAAVTILDTESAVGDLLSTSLLSPPGGVTLTQNVPVNLQADVETLSGTLANVEFYAVDSAGNSTDLGGTADPHGQIAWVPTATGTFTLEVVSTDVQGNTQQATVSVSVVAASSVPAVPQATLEGGLDGTTFVLDDTVDVVVQVVDSQGNALANAQFYLDGVPLATTPADSKDAIRRAGVKAATVSAGSGTSLYSKASVPVSKPQQSLTASGTTSSGVSAVSNAAMLYGKINAGTPPAVALTGLSSGDSVTAGSAGQSVTVAASAGSLPVDHVDLFVDNANVGTATTAPYTFSLPALSAGPHALIAKATDTSLLSKVSEPVVVKAEAVYTTPAFFSGQAALSNGVYYLAFPDGNYFGYYSFLSDPDYIYHFDLGYEYVFEATDGKAGVYFYDFASSTFFYTSPSFPFPYLYDFTLNSVLYYFPDPNNAGHYNTNGTRYFYDFATQQIITK